MKLSGTQTFPAPRQQVWDFLTDPQRLAKCMPGCEKLETVGEHEYSGVLNVGLAAVKGVYNGKVKLRSEEHTSELQSRPHLVCRLLLEKKKKQLNNNN